MRAVILLAGLLAAGPVLAAESGAPGAVPNGAANGAGDCAAVEGPANQLICREAAPTAARMEEALKALSDQAGEPGREAVAYGQRAWIQRRDAACPVADADLADPKKAKDRTACLTRQMAERTKALETELAARRAPVADEALTITDAGPSRVAAAPAKAAPAKRAPGMAALTGRWAKADPVTRLPIDDCRASYLDIGKEPAVSLHDPRIPGLPVDGRVTVEDGDLAQGIAFRAADRGPSGKLRLESGEVPRLDRLFLRLDQPFAFGATFVRCR